MKIIKLLTLLTFLSVSSFAQKFDDLKLTFDYIQLPLQPINKSTVNYTTKIVQTYEADVIAKKAAHDQSVKDADAKYQADKAEYAKKNVGMKFLENSMGESTKPTKEYVASEKYQKIHQADALAGYVKLEGYKSSPDNAVTILLTMEGFESTEPVLKTSTEQKVVNGANTTTYKYKYEVKYKHPIGVKVDAPGQGTLLDEHPAKFNEFKTAETSYYNSEQELRNGWSAYMESLQNSIVRENLQVINELVNSKFGFVKKKRETEINCAKDKNIHEDYQKAYEASSAGYMQITNPTMKEQVFANLKKATELWETALKESNMTDKKARINEKVTVATIQNVAEAYMWLNDFNTAEMYLNKLMIMDISGRDKKNAEKNREFLKSQRERFDANTNN
jgi:hypothetical protein